MLEHARLVDDGKIIELHLPMKLKLRSGRKEIILPPESQREKPASALQLALAQAFRWQKMLDDGEVESASELARLLGLDSSHVARTLRLALLAPDIIESILDGNEPDGLSLTTLRRALPMLWEEQREMLSHPRGKQHPSPG